MNKMEEELVRIPSVLGLCMHAHMCAYMYVETCIQAIHNIYIKENGGGEISPPNVSATLKSIGNVLECQLKVEN